MQGGAGSWIVTVGDEILSGHTVDTNSSWLAQQLSATPYPCSRISVVADDEDQIVEELSRARSGPPDRIFCCGGLGPTPDDRTMAALARLLQVPLVEEPTALAHIRATVERRYREGRLPSPEPNPGTLKMALVPQGAIVLQNPVGSAPPLAVPLTPERWLFALPGVPTEFREAAAQEVIPVFCAGEAARKYQQLEFQDIPESRFFPLLLELEQEYPDVRFGSYPQGRGRLVIRASAADRSRLELALATLGRRAPGSSSG